MRRTKPTKTTQSPRNVPRQPGDEGDGKNEKRNHRREHEDEGLEFAPEIDERICRGRDRALDDSAEVLAHDRDAAGVGADVAGRKAQIDAAVVDEPGRLGEARDENVEPPGDRRPEDQPQGRSSISHDFAALCRRELAPNLHVAASSVLASAIRIARAMIGAGWLARTLMLGAAT